VIVTPCSAHSFWLFVAEFDFAILQCPQILAAVEAGADQFCLFHERVFSPAKFGRAAQLTIASQMMFVLNPHSGAPKDCPLLLLLSSTAPEASVKGADLTFTKSFHARLPYNCSHSANFCRCVLTRF
jgi:hypothetical protein